MPEPDQHSKVVDSCKPELLLDRKSEVPESLRCLVGEAWQRADLTQAYEHQDHLSVVVNMKRVIGKSQVVRTRTIAPSDPAMFSRKRHRRYVSRVIKTNKLPESRYLSLTCDRFERGWRLRRAEIGAFIAPEPMDFTTILRQGAKLRTVLHYWTRHAHVYSDDRFSTAAHTDTWTRVLSKAQLNHRPEVLQQVGYFEVAAAHDIIIDLTNGKE